MTSLDNHLTLKMASAQVVETSVAKNSLSQDSNHAYDLFHSRHQLSISVEQSSTYKTSGPRRSVKITDRFTCTSVNVIYCITCTLCKKLYIGKTGRRLGDRFREHLRDVEKDDKDASHFNLPNHSKEHMSI